MDLNFGSLMSQVSETVASLNSNTADAVAATKTATDIADGRAQQARETASAAERITRIKLEDQARQENSRRRVAGQIGSDPDQVGYLGIQIADRVKNADAVIQAEAAQIAEIDSVGFLDNPLQFIVGQLQRKQHVVAHNAAVDAQEQAKELNSNLSTITTDAFKNINALSQTVSEAYIQSATLVEANQFNAQASDAALQAVRYNLEGIRLAGDRSKEQLNIMFQADSARRGEAQMGISLAHLNIAKADFDLKKKAYEEKTNEDNLILKYVQTGYFAHSGKQMDPARAKDVVALYKAKNPDIQAMFDAGLASSMSGHLMVSSSPFDATTLYATGKLNSLPAAQKVVAEQLTTWRRAWEKTPEGMAAIQGKDKTGAERSFNDFVKIQQRVGGSEVFKPMPLTQAAANSKVIQSSPVWRDILAPAAQSGVNVDDPNVAFGLITSGIQSGKLSYVDATDYSSVVASALDLNNQAKNFLAFGVPPATGYQGNLTMPMSFGKTGVNLTDRREFTTALNKALALRAYQESAVVKDRSWPSVIKPMLPSPARPAPNGSSITYPGNEEERLRNIRIRGESQ